MVQQLSNANGAVLRTAFSGRGAVGKGYAYNYDPNKLERTHCIGCRQRLGLLARAVCAPMLPYLCVYKACVNLKVAAGACVSFCWCDRMSLTGRKIHMLSSAVSCSHVPVNNPVPLPCRTRSFKTSP